MAERKEKKKYGVDREEEKERAPLCGERKKRSFISSASAGVHTESINYDAPSLRKHSAKLNFSLPFCISTTINRSSCFPHHQKDFGECSDPLHNTESGRLKGFRLSITK